MNTKAKPIALVIRAILTAIIIYRRWCLFLDLFRSVSLV